MTTEIVLRDTLHVVLGGEENYAFFLWNELFFRELANFVIDNLGAARIIVFLFHSDELFLDYAENFLFVCKDSFEFLDKLVEFFQLFFDLVAF